jgi:hypothetical protein
MHQQPRPSMLASGGKPSLGSALPLSAITRGTRQVPDAAARPHANRLMLHDRARVVSDRSPASSRASVVEF